MARRSTVKALPEDILRKLERKLVAGNFSDYTGLAEWLKGVGFEISRSAVHRYGSGFEQSLASLKESTQMARFLAEELGDDEGVIADASIRIFQDQLFRVLQEMKLDPEKLDPHKIGRVLADLSRASISQKKWAAEYRERAAKRAGAELEKEAKRQGLSDVGVAKLQEALRAGLAKG